MEIRNIEIDDIEALADLYFHFWEEESNVNEMKRKFNELKNNGNYILLCADEKNKVVGSVMGIVCEDLYGECKPYLLLENMIVDRTFRRKGIGIALFSELEKQARMKGCTQIILVTEANRTDACMFYESVGFHPTANKGYKKRM